MAIETRRGAWVRISSLFLLDGLFLLAGVLALQGRFEALAGVIVVGAVLAIAFNLYLLWRARTTEATWQPGSGSGVLKASLGRIGVTSRAPVVLWEVIGAVAIVVNLVAIVVA